MSAAPKPDAQPVRVEKTDGYAEIVLNRPHRRNALTLPAMTALTDAFHQIDGDDQVEAVVLRGEAEFFCSGLDLKEIDTGQPPTATWIGVHRALAALDVPIVCALQGGAINAGAALALACDLMVVGDGAYLQIKEAEMGMTPPVNATWLALRYPAAVGLQLALSCRRFPGPDLVRLTVALESVADQDVLTKARALAAQLASYPGRGAALTKRALRDARGENIDQFSRVAEARAAQGGNRD